MIGLCSKSDVRFKLSRPNCRDEVDCDVFYVFLTILFMGISCPRDDFVELSIAVKVIGPTMSVFFSHILFV